MTNESSFFATRHSTPERNKTPQDPASKEYPDLTEGGVEKAKAKARSEIAELIKKAPADAVIIIAATSDQPRAKQTAEIYGDELTVLQSQTQDENLITITKKQIDQLTPAVPEEQADKKGFMPGKIIQTVNKLKEVISQNPDKKIIIGYPIMVNELAYKFRNRWTDKAGKKTEYFSEILKKHSNNHEEAGKDWIANDGKLELPNGRTIQGPHPADVGKEYLQGVRRLQEFAKSHIGNRPVIVGEVGHQWDLDALVTALANNGKVGMESFNRITGGDIAGETEMTEFTIADNRTTVKYRGKKFITSHDAD